MYRSELVPVGGTCRNNLKSNGFFRTAIMFVVFFAVCVFFTAVFAVDVHAAGDNANLKGFIVKGAKSRPAFDKDIVRYAVDVSREVTEVEIIGIPEDPEATVVSPGIVKDLPLESTLKKKIVVTSADGTVTKEYAFYITRYDRIITPVPASVSPSPEETPDTSPEDSADVTEQDTAGPDETLAGTGDPDTTSSPEASSSPASGSNKKKKNDGDMETASKGFSGGDMAVCTILAFLSGILIGYAVFYFSDRWKKISKSKV